jgi:aspartate racemase
VKKIGLVGGVGWRSTSEYYRLINEEVERRLGGLHSMPLGLESLDFAQVRQHVDEGDEDALVELYVGAAQRLESAGAQLLALCSNAAHARIHRVREHVRVPVIHIADPVCAAARSQGHTRVGLLGTRETMQRPFMKDVLAASGLHVHVPEEADQAWLHATIFGVLEQGRQTREHQAQFLQVVERLAHAGAQAVVLGCTELPLLLDDGQSAVPCLDTTRLHAHALVDAALAPTH